MPLERTGVYMGIVNVFIVNPMLLQTLTAAPFGGHTVAFASSPAFTR